MKKKLLVLGVLAVLVLSVGVAYAVWPPDLSRIPKGYYNSSASWDGRRLLGLAWYRLLNHTHSGGFEQGKPIGTTGLANSAITSAKIADGIIATADLANDSVTTTKIAAGAVGTTDIAAGAITTALIADGTIATADIALNAITSALIAADTITEADIAADAVTKSELGITVVDITVDAAATSGSSAANPALVGGEILGYYPTGNQDQLVNNVVLNANGSVTVTLADAATADNTFKVVVLKP